MKIVSASLPPPSVFVGCEPRMTSAPAGLSVQNTLRKLGVGDEKQSGIRLFYDEATFFFCAAEQDEPIANVDDMKLLS